jgi:hypothetical protein
MVAILGQRPDGRLDWRAFAGDRKLEAALPSFGGLTVAIDPVVDDAIEWPAANRLTESLDGFLRDGIGAARAFVAGRLDLARLLASESDVRRGSLTTWLPPANYPARLVQALIMARDLGSTELENEIRERLNGGPQILPSGREVDLASDAEDWARQYAKALGREVAL